MGKINTVVLVVLVACLCASCGTINKAVDDALGRNPGVDTLYYDKADVEAYIAELSSKPPPADDEAIVPGPEPGTFIVKEYVLDAAFADHVKARMSEKRVDKFADKHKDQTWARVVISDLGNILLTVIAIIWIGGGL